jgi:dTDP-4-dehydrorhamnose reductase
MKRLLITGASGNLGRVLSRQAEMSWQVWSTYCTNPHIGGGTACRLDLRSRDETLDLVNAVMPDVIIHTAGSDRSPDMENASRQGALHIRSAAAEVGSRLLALSTDLVFDGTRAPYREQDPPNPTSPYARVKAENERYLIEYDRALVVRTSLIYDSDQQNNQLRWMQTVIGEGKRVPLFTDEIRQPISAQDLSRALLELADGTQSGILNVAGPERLSRWEYGSLLLELLGYEPGRVASKVLAADVAPDRPRDCSLDLSAAARLLSTRIRPVREALGLDAL